MSKKTQILIFLGIVIFLFKDKLFRMYKDFTETDKKKVMLHTMKWEGDKSSDPSDSASSFYCPTLFKGKKYHTVKGVTYKTWHGVHGAAHDDRFLNMSTKDWFDIYYNKYYKACNADKFKAWQIGVTLTQFCWGSGVYGGSKLFQKILNTDFNAGLTVDGKIGEKTITFANKIPRQKLFDSLIKGRASFFENISQNGDNHKFLKGWMNRLNDFNKTFRP